MILPRRVPSGRHRSCQLLPPSSTLHRAWLPAWFDCPSSTDPSASPGRRLSVVRLAFAARPASHPRPAWLPPAPACRPSQHRSISTPRQSCPSVEEDLERARRFELSMNSSMSSGVRPRTTMLTARRTAVDAGAHRHEHHVRRQRRLEIIEERRPRERPLIDQPCSLPRAAAATDGELFGVDALANAHRFTR